LAAGFTIRHFEGRIHEQVLGAISSSGGKIVNTPLLAIENRRRSERASTTQP
jgi:hypothetical protein